MGVYINMEMPKDGEKLYMIVFSDGKACASYKPFEWHEVVSLPPHGRLIDADELTALVYANIALFDSAPGRMGEEQKLVRAWLASMVDDINDAPTIIEADPAEEGET